MISLSLPFPPSSNHLYATFRGRRLLSKEGRNYHTRIVMLCRQLLGPPDPIMGRIRLTIKAHPPDNHRRDLSNLIKATEDALTKAKVWTDDSQVDDLRIMRGERQEGGRINVEIEEIA